MVDEIYYEEESLEEKIYLLMRYVDDLYELKRDRSFYFKNQINDEIIATEEDIKWYTGDWYYPSKDKRPSIDDDLDYLTD